MQGTTTQRELLQQVIKLVENDSSESSAPVLSLLKQMDSKYKD